jgi:hypothetical protein
MLRYTYIASVFIFASIMNEILHQHLHAPSVSNFSNVHICIRLQCLFWHIIKPLAKILLRIETH